MNAKYTSSDAELHQNLLMLSSDADATAPV